MLYTQSCSHGTCRWPPAKRPSWSAVRSLARFCHRAAWRSTSTIHAVSTGNGMHPGWVDDTADGRCYGPAGVFRRSYDETRRLTGQLTRRKRVEVDKVAFWPIAVDDHRDDAKESVSYRRGRHAAITHHGRSSERSLPPHISHAILTRQHGRENNDRRGSSNPASPQRRYVMAHSAPHTCSGSYKWWSQWQ